MAVLDGCVSAVGTGLDGHRRLGRVDERVEEVQLLLYVDHGRLFVGTSYRSTSYLIREKLHRNKSLVV